VYNSEVSTFQHTGFACPPPKKKDKHTHSFNGPLSGTKKTKYWTFWVGAITQHAAQTAKFQTIGFILGLVDISRICLLYASFDGRHRVWAV